MAKHYKQIVMGIIFIVININIQSFDIMPDIVGYFLITRSLMGLYKSTEIKEFNIGSKIADIIIITDIILFFLYFNQDIQEIEVSLPINIIDQMIFLVLVFYIYEATIKLAVNPEIKQRIENGRRFYLYTQLISIFLITYSINMNESAQFTLIIICGCANIISMIVWATNMNLMKKYFNGEIKYENKVDLYL
ncbi:hypothetical protein SH1V18_26650 [Vallitalea longa]|uniref:Uncharacterized protein n=1 Tax=Vallitalea longa TaxID=2936439 RepID=A0A9W5YCQ7_9FIRM|nr:hypothetical protein [Vallitalea longa]GKX30185.1 hypothetical protein SH1V18_26650 [Vallitalea longa]